MHYKSMIYERQFNIFVFYVIAYFMTECFAVVEYDRPLIASQDSTLSL